MRHLQAAPPVPKLVTVAPGVQIDPTEVDLLSGDTTGHTRIYMRGAQGQWWIPVARPLPDVVRALYDHPATGPSTGPTSATG